MPKFLVLIAASLVFSACAFEKVEPWDREYLAEDKMQLVPDTLEYAFDEHIYFSNEAASGGQSVGGGGCGCN